jgi:hypothetical protein
LQVPTMTARHHLLRIPPALWLIGLAIAVSHLTR